MWVPHVISRKQLGVVAEPEVPGCVEGWVVRDALEIQLFEN